VLLLLLMLLPLLMLLSSSSSSSCDENAAPPFPFLLPPRKKAFIKWPFSTSQTSFTSSGKLEYQVKAGPRDIFTWKIAFMSSGSPRHACWRVSHHRKARLPGLPSKSSTDSSAVLKRVSFDTWKAIVQYPQWVIPFSESIKVFEATDPSWSSSAIVFRFRELRRRRRSKDRRRPMLLPIWWSMLGNHERWLYPAEGERNIIIAEWRLLHHKSYSRAGRKWLGFTCFIIFIS